MSFIKLTIPICGCGQKAVKCDYCKLRLCDECMLLYNIEYITCKMCKRTSCYQHHQQGFSPHKMSIRKAPLVGSPKEQINYEIKLRNFIRKTRNENVEGYVQRYDAWCLKMGVIPVKPKRNLPIVLLQSGDMTCCSCKIAI